MYIKICFLFSFINVYAILFGNIEIAYKTIEIKEDYVLVKMQLDTIACNTNVFEHEMGHLILSMLHGVVVQEFSSNEDDEGYVNTYDPQPDCLEDILKLIEINAGGCAMELCKGKMFEYEYDEDEKNDITTISTLNQSLLNLLNNNTDTLYKILCLRYPHTQLWKNKNQFIEVMIGDNCCFAWIYLTYEYFFQTNDIREDKYKKTLKHMMNHRKQVSKTQKSKPIHYTFSANDKFEISESIVTQGCTMGFDNDLYFGIEYEDPIKSDDFNDFDHAMGKAIVAKQYGREIKTFIVNTENNKIVAKITFFEKNNDLDSLFQSLEIVASGCAKDFQKHEKFSFLRYYDEIVDMQLLYDKILEKFETFDKFIENFIERYPGVLTPLNYISEPPYRGEDGVLWTQKDYLIYKLTGFRFYFCFIYLVYEKFFSNNTWQSSYIAIAKEIGVFNENYQNKTLDEYKYIKKLIKKIEGGVVSLNYTKDFDDCGCIDMNNITDNDEPNNEEPNIIISNFYKTTPKEIEVDPIDESEQTTTKISEDRNTKKVIEEVLVNKEIEDHKNISSLRENELIKSTVNQLELNDLQTDQEVEDILIDNEQFGESKGLGLLFFIKTFVLLLVVIVILVILWYIYKCVYKCVV